MNTPVFQEPMAVFGVLAAVFALVFWLSGLAPLRGFFSYLPAVIWAYFVPTLCTTFGLIPASSPVYGWMVRYLLPLALLLLMITMDVKSVLRLGPLAGAMMLAGSIGTIVGGPVVFLLFGKFLPPESWKGLAALSGSWIGGSANLVAIAESVRTPDGILGPIIIVDTVVGYGWMAVLLMLSARQDAFNRWNHARTDVLDEAHERVHAASIARKPLDVRSAAIILGAGFAAAVLAVAAGARLPELGRPTIISATTWTVLMVVTGGLLVSFTPVRGLEAAGASQLGYAALYLLLTAIGAQANLHAVLAAPLFLAAGVCWIVIHGACLLLAARLLRAPLLLFATGSMANIGGTATAPLVASVYHPAMAPVGLLMAVGGYVLGIYGGLFCAFLLGALAT